MRNQRRLARTRGRLQHGRPGLVQGTGEFGEQRSMRESGGFHARTVSCAARAPATAPLAGPLYRDDLGRAAEAWPARVRSSPPERDAPMPTARPGGGRPPPQPDQVDVCGLTHPGLVRTENQDLFLIATPPQVDAGDPDQRACGGAGRPPQPQPRLRLAGCGRGRRHTGGTGRQPDRAALRSWTMC